MKCHLVPQLLLLLLAVAAPALRADYPIVSQRYLADPGALVYQGRVYLYCSNDDENPVGGGYVMKSIVCVSSADLKNWTDHGVVFRVPANASWAGNSWAPAAVARYGQIYLYFANNASGIGVATGPTPIGPFNDARGSVLINANTPGAAGPNIWLFDPSVLVDDDGQAYLYFGGNGIANARVIKLNPDMISTSGSAATISTPNFFEDSWIIKRNGTYYYSYSSNPSSGLTIDYMTSTSPMSGFTYAGTVAGQPPSNNNNNHHAIFALNGAWYHAYHNRYDATQAGIPTTYRRNLGVEALNFNPDGTIQRVTYTTDGLPQLSQVNPYVRQEAEMTNAQNAIATEPCSSGGMDVQYTQDGAWTKMRGVDFGTAGAASFEATVATATGGGTLEIRLGSPTGTLAGSCAVAGTGGVQTWTTTSCAITGAAGVQDVYLVFHGTGSNQLSVDWWRFAPIQPLILTQPADKTVFPGSPISVSVGVAGTGNAYQWHRDGTTLAGQTQSTLWINNAAISDSGTYSATITNGTGTTTTRGAVVSVRQDAARIVNMSCRIQLNSGQLVSPGFYISGTGRKQVLVRAAGPALTAIGLPGAMPDPQLTVFQGQAIIAQNDNWDPNVIGDAFTRVAAFGFPAGSRDAALLVTLDAGRTYTAQVGGVAGSSGIVLLEVYDADPAATTSKLSNVSVRGVAGNADASLILGFVISGSGDRTMLIRGAGPALAPIGVTDALTDPELALYDVNRNLLQTNYGWTSGGGDAQLSTVFQAVGAFPFGAGSRDAAMLSTVSPANYTVHITSASGLAGEAVAEVYEVP